MDHLVQVLNASIAPCVLISAFGLLLLSMTNRLARPIDRIRELAHLTAGESEAERRSHKRQIDILHRRCLLLKRAIQCIGIGIFLVSLLMLILFASLIFKLDLALVSMLVFVAALVSLIAGVGSFLLDIRLTLRSVEIEAEAFLAHG